MTNHIFLILIVLPISLQAQTNNIILEACNSISSSEKRLECLKAAVNSTDVALVKDRAFIPLENSFTKMHAGIRMGISFLDYQHALLDLANELAIYDKLAPGNSRAGVALLEQALAQYKDARVIWSYVIDRVPGWSPEMAFESRSKIWERAIDLADRGIKAVTEGGLPKNILPLPNLNNDLQGESRMLEDSAVELLAKNIGCNTNPVAARTASKPAFNEYTIYCVSGKILTFQCTKKSCEISPWPP